jgi:phosphoserine phosphatase
MREIVLIKVAGEDRPGITAELTSVLARYEVRILDMSQAVVHETLSLGVLVEIPAAQAASPVFKELLYRGNELGIKVSFFPVAEESYEEWAGGGSAQRYIVTLLAREIHAVHVAGLAGILSEAGLNIENISRLSRRESLAEPPDPPRACLEFGIRGEPCDQAALKRAFLDLSMRTGVDVAFQEDDVFRRNRRIIALDMDSTLIRAEFINELAAEAGAGAEVATVTEAAMRGELDFEQSLRSRVALLEGLPEEAMKRVAERIELTEGARRLVSNLKAQGYKVAILSGGFTYIGEKLQRKLGVDYLHANELEIADGKLTGGLVGEVVDGRMKAELLKDIVRREGLYLQQAVAVGDGANDLPMLEIAGLGIAFHAKPLVKEGAEQSISAMGLDGILYLLGMRDREALT